MSKNFSKGFLLEQLHSEIIHARGIPILVAPSFLRRFGAGQIDLGVIENGIIKIYEVKSSLRISYRQQRRLKKSAQILSHLFGLPARVYLRVGLPK